MLVPCYPRLTLPVSLLQSCLLRRSPRVLPLSALDRTVPTQPPTCWVLFPLLTRQKQQVTRVVRLQPRPVPLFANREQGTPTQVLRLGVLKLLLRVCFFAPPPLHLAMWEITRDWPVLKPKWFLVQGATFTHLVEFL